MARKEVEGRLRAFAAELGRLGGKAGKGEAKRRGDAAYYSGLAKKRKRRTKRVASTAVALLALALMAACGSEFPTAPAPDAAVLPTSSTETPHETWIIWGQSNALGCAEGPGNVGAPGVDAWNGSAWIPAVEAPVLPFMEPYFNVNGPRCESGWAVMAADLVRRPVRLTGHAVAGKSLSYWLDDPTPLRRRLVDARGALWMIAYQGESDALRRSTTWSADFARLVALVRAEVQNPEMRVLVVGLADGPNDALWRGLREQQRAFVANDSLAAFVSAEGLELQPDKTHLTRWGYERLAHRVAQVVY